MGSTVNLSRWFALTVLICICWPLSVQAQSSSLKISEKTKHYNISGKTAAEFARSHEPQRPLFPPTSASRLGNGNAKHDVSVGPSKKQKALSD